MLGSPRPTLCHAVITNKAIHRHIDGRFVTDRVSDAMSLETSPYGNGRGDIVIHTPKGRTPLYDVSEMDIALDALMKAMDRMPTPA